MMANVITGIRILVSAALLFCPVFSPIFYAMYLIAGLSDMADGIVARKTNSVSEFGSRFDGVADFVFVAVCLIKILPVSRLYTREFRYVQWRHLRLFRKDIS